MYGLSLQAHLACRRCPPAGQHTASAPCVRDSVDVRGARQRALYDVRRGRSCLTARDTPGKRHYQLALHLDSAWGYSLVPMTVVRGGDRGDTGIAVIGGTHGNEYEGQIAV